MKYMRNNDVDYLRRGNSPGDYFEDRNYVVYRTSAIK